MSSLYESNNNNSEPNSNEFWYDKNEFYAENGLSRGQKKDRKSHGKKAQEQHEQREDKVSKQVLLLPKKMQKALKALDKDKVVSVKTKEKEVSNPQQVKQVKYIKTINRRGKKEDFALALTDSVEEDASNEVVKVATSNEEVVVDAYTYIKAKREFQMYPDNWTEDELQQFKETIDRYEALNSYDQGVKMWQLHGLTEKDYIENMEKEMREKSRFENWCFDDEEEEVVNDYTEYNDTYINYINAKREFQMYSEQWSEKELQKFKEIIDSYEALSDYERGVRMWQSYGLSEAQYVAHQEKELNVDSLFEEWYYDEAHQDAIYSQEDDDAAAADYADWLEAKEEERIENAIQNCLDDMYSDSD
jgi:hypothetical protein